MKQKSGNLKVLRNEKEAIVATENAVAVQALNHYLHAATSKNTRKAYQSDIRHFLQWGGFLPTTTDVILHYLQQHATTLNTRTLIRRLTALKNWHVYQGFPDPTVHPLLRKTLVGIKNTHGKPKNKAPALTLPSLTEMVRHLKNSPRLIDVRNCALLQIGFFGAFRRSELVSITWENIHFVVEGIEILILRSKTDQGNEGQTCAIPYGDETLCPITALTAWRDRANCQTGYVFRQMTAGGNIKDDPISPNQVNLIIKSIAVASQIPNAEDYSSHSLRRGFATEASKKGAPFGAIMRQGRWQHEGTVLGYIDEGKRFDQNAADFMLNTEKKNE